MNAPAGPTSEDLDTPADGGTPLHGYPGVARPPERLPVGLSIAVSREAGARGRTIALHVGRLLGWPVYSQEELESLSLDGPVRDTFLADLPTGLAEWADVRLAHLQRDRINRDPDLTRLARLILTLGAQGEAIFVGRGAGYLLPPATTLHVRIVAPLADRIVAMGQWLRLPLEEAAAQVRQRDQARAVFLDRHFGVRTDQMGRFDLILNSSRLGEELTAELIAQAARAKSAARGERTPEE
jgi:cytidylate kinase